jgi:hypothetical protein
MTRSLTKLALVGAVCALLATPGVAAAQTVAEVDEQTGPVSFANGASILIDAGKVVTETQRSPLRAGQSRLSQDRTSVPKSGDQGELNAMGPNFVVQLGTFSGQSPFPAGVKSQEHEVIAALQDTNVPTATATANYALLDNSRGRATPGENSLFAFQNAKSVVDCSTTKTVKSTTTADKLWVRDAEDKLVQVGVPAGTDKVEVGGIRAGAPMKIDNVDLSKTTAKLTISRVTQFDQLIRQNVWRGGDITAVGGWLAELDTHVIRTDGSFADVHTKVVLGGVSCSLPKTFAKLTPGTPSAQVTPTVPTNVPAGGVPVAAEAASTSQGSALGFVLFGGGLVLAAAAVLTLRRRKPGADRRE